MQSIILGQTEIESVTQLIFLIGVACAAFVMRDFRVVNEFFKTKMMSLGVRSLLLVGLVMGGCSFLERDKTNESELPSQTEQTAPGLKKSASSEKTPLASSEEKEEVELTSNTEEDETADASEKEPEDAQSEDAEKETSESPSDEVDETAVREFIDLDDVAAKEDIANLNKLGVFEGNRSEFKPYETLTRGEYVAWLFKANNAIRREADHIRLDPTFDPGYEDLKEDHPAYKYVQAFANAGFAVGYDNNTFKPDQPITREEMIAIKVGLDGNEVYEPLKNIKGYLKFTDADQISPKYTGYIYHDQFGKKNIGRAFGSVKNFKPQQAVKRHEAAATLSKVKGATAENAVKELEREQARSKKNS